jgi:hypothetical protein
MVEQGRRNSSDVAASRRRLLLAVVSAGVFLLGVGAAMIGQPGEALPSRVVLLLGEVLYAWPAALYLFAAYGLGRLAWPLWHQAQDKAACQLASGLAIALTLSHLLGVLGFLTPTTALAVCAIGIALAVRQIMGWKHESRVAPPMPSWVWLAALPVCGVVVAAVGVPPGVLWGSEFGGFDVLSYHLQLPQEWIAAGRIWPVEHNVYSYLPGYVEAAYTHVTLLSFPPSVNALTAEDGWRMTSAHALHAGMWGIGAWLCARAGTGLLRQAGVGEGVARHAGAAGGVLVATTPWTVVVGTIAYNEMAVIALCAGGVLVASERGIRPLQRGALCGLLVGVAAGAKPSAALMAAPLVGVMLLGLEPLKHWRGLVIGGLIAGVLSVLPWLIRNAVACGNPIFPFGTDILGTGVFGTAHWTSEQAARWSAGHHADGGLFERLRLLVSADPAASAQSVAVVRHRGMSNPQWALVFPVLGVMLVLGVLLARVRTMTVLLLLGTLGGLIVWLFMTHHQSRFLMPLVLSGGLALTLVVGELASRDGPGRIALSVGAVLGLAQCAQTWRIWSDQIGGVPAGLLGQGSMWFTRAMFVEPAERELTPLGFVHLHEADMQGRLYLLGDSTPFYWPGRVVYHTTWDASPIAEAVRTHPDDADAWIAALRAQGIGYILLNAAELARLEDSGWLAPELAAQHVGSLIGPCELVKSWPSVGQALYRLPDAAKTSLSEPVGQGRSE